MLTEILKIKDFPSTFKITSQKKKFEEYGGTLPDAFKNIDEINKDYVIKLIKKNKGNNKEEFLAILFWGIYFSAVKKKPAVDLIHFLNSKNFDEEFEKRKKIIINSNSSSNLFNSFQKELKIPGIDYAYFTKIFFFYRFTNNKEPYLILDKWLSMAWCALDGLQNNNIKTFTKYYSGKTNFYFDGILKRQKPQAYQEYLSFMKNLAQKYNLDVIYLEEKLFGVDFKIEKVHNPRFIYLKWALNNQIPLISTSKDVTSKKSKNIKINDINKFNLKKTNQYIGLYSDSNFRSKEGYVDKKGWLCASDILKNRLVTFNFNWQNGNTKGGSKEKNKFKFSSQEDCLEQIKDFINTSNYIDSFKD